MKVTESPTPMLLAVLLDGSEGPQRLCGLCRRPMVEFVTSPGLRKKVTSLPERSIACVNTKAIMGRLPCPGALRAKPILDALQQAVLA